MNSNNQPRYLKNPTRGRSPKRAARKRGGKYSGKNGKKYVFNKQQRKKLQRDMQRNNIERRYKSGSLRNQRIGNSQANSPNRPYKNTRKVRSQSRSPSKTSRFTDRL